MRLRTMLACLLLTSLAGCSGGTGGEDDPGDDGDLPTGGQGSGGGQGTTWQGATGTTGTTSAQPADYNVEMHDSRFDPTTLTVPNYQKVVFENKGSLSHTVTIVRQGDPAGTTYRDQAVQTGANVDYNFPNDGTYIVYCRYHGSETSGMRMTITV